MKQDDNSILWCALDLLWSILMKMTYYTVYKYVSAVTIIIQHDKVKKKKANRETKTDRMIDEKLVVYYGKKCTVMQN